MSEEPIAVSESNLGKLKHSSQSPIRRTRNQAQQPEKSIDFLSRRRRERLEAVRRWQQQITCLSARSGQKESAHHGTMLQSSATGKSTDKSHLAQELPISSGDTDAMGHFQGLDIEEEYLVEWKLHNYLSVCYAPSQDIGSILTVTGNATTAWVTTCQNYLKTMFPIVGPVLLAGLEELQSERRLAEATETEFSGKGKTHMGQGIRLYLTELERGHKNSVVVAVTAPHELQVEACLAISWVSATFRPCLPGERYLSTVRTNHSATGLYMDIICNDLEPIKGSQAACWHKLLPSTVVASFPIPERAFGKGLEISFDHMTMLARSLNLVEYNFGFVAEGLNSVLIPVEMSEDDAIQWHLEWKITRKSPESKPQRVQAFEILRGYRYAAWRKDLSPTNLQGRRCFLGWVDHAEVQVGSKYFDLKVGLSGASNCLSTGRQKSYGLQVGSSGMGIFGAQLLVTVGPSTAPRKLLEANSNDLDDTLQDSCEVQVLVYDHVAKTAWLIPKINIILHMLHAIAKLRSYKVLDSDGEASKLAFAEAGTGRPQEAYEAIHKSLQLQFKKAYGNEMVSEAVARISARLDIVAGRIFSTLDKARKGGTGAPSNLFGYEYREVLQNLSDSAVKMHRVDQPWASLSEVFGIVLFCGNYGQAIKPAIPGNICSAWQTVPSGKYYLAASGYSLQELIAKTRGSRLSDRVDWRNGPPLIQCHTRFEKPVHTQILVSHDHPKERSLGKWLSGSLDGAFIFDQSTVRKACSAPITKHSCANNGQPVLKMANTYTPSTALSPTLQSTVSSHVDDNVTMPTRILREPLTPYYNRRDVNNRASGGGEQDNPPPQQPIKSTWSSTVQNAPFFSSSKLTHPHKSIYAQPNLPLSPPSSSPATQRYSNVSIASALPESPASQPLDRNSSRTVTETTEQGYGSSNSRMLRKVKATTNLRGWRSEDRRD